ncbi:DUF938 domain-containing protein [Brevundimonas sp. FT23042]|uniref:DUF938 domain-containing protein n=1 Tax=Brevundimonas sp. FT23042 TaxID=3393749 RepID=UPI003B585BDB
MQTMDALTATPEGGLNSAASVRNAGPILEVLKAHLPARGRVLEIAGGSGQHAVAFAGALPGLDWTPSDPSAEARASMAAWAGQAKLPNLNPPMALDMLDEAGWPTGVFEAMVCINMIHISPWAATEGLMRLAGRSLLRPGGLLVLYGPYREAEIDLAPSNADFDLSLQRRNPDWGLRDREAVTAEGKTAGLALTRRVEMPANNIMLLFRAI